MIFHLRHQLDTYFTHTQKGIKAGSASTAAQQLFRSCAKRGMADMLVLICAAAILLLMVLLSILAAKMISTLFRIPVHEPENRRLIYDAPDLETYSAVPMTDHPHFRILEEYEQSISLLNQTKKTTNSAKKTRKNNFLFWL
ncbi:hypothetical protein X975_13961, partial [Stegodyphus mimosarum]